MSNKTNSSHQNHSTKKSDILFDQLSNDLNMILSSRCLFVGTGNRMRGDDAAGPMVIDALAEAYGPMALDAGVAPENYLGKIIKLQPETVIIIDIIDFKADPGTIKLFDIDTIASMHLSTHALSLKMTAEYLKNRMECRIFLLGIQPKLIELQEKISEEVLKSINALGDLLVTLKKQERCSHTVF